MVPGKMCRQAWCKTGFGGVEVEWRRNSTCFESGGGAPGLMCSFDVRFYVILFLFIYGFAVAVHLFFDYRQWESERARDQGRVRTFGDFPCLFR